MKKEKKKLKIIHDEHDFRKKPKNYVREDLLLRLY